MVNSIPVLGSIFSFLKSPDHPENSTAQQKETLDFFGSESHSNKTDQDMIDFIEKKYSFDVFKGKWIHRTTGAEATIDFKTRLVTVTETRDYETTTYKYGQPAPAHKSYKAPNDYEHATLNNVRDNLSAEGHLDDPKGFMKNPKTGDIAVFNEKDQTVTIGKALQKKVTSFTYGSNIPENAGSLENDPIYGTKARNQFDQKPTERRSRGITPTPNSDSKPVSLQKILISQGYKLEIIDGIKTWHNAATGHKLPVQPISGMNKAQFKERLKAGEWVNHVGPGFDYWQSPFSKATIQINYDNTWTLSAPIDKASASARNTRMLKYLALEKEDATKNIHWSDSEGLAKAEANVDNRFMNKVKKIFTYRGKYNQKNPNPPKETASPKPTLDFRAFSGNITPEMKNNLILGLTTELIDIFSSKLEGKEKAEQAIGAMGREFQSFALSMYLGPSMTFGIDLGKSLTNIWTSDASLHDKSHATISTLVNTGISLAPFTSVAKYGKGAVLAVSYISIISKQFNKHAREYEANTPKNPTFADKLNYVITNWVGKFDKLKQDVSDGVADLLMGDIPIGQLYYDNFKNLDYMLVHPNYPVWAPITKPKVTDKPAEDLNVLNLHIQDQMIKELNSLWDGDSEKFESKNPSSPAEPAQDHPAQAEVEEPVKLDAGSIVRENNPKHVPKPTLQELSKIKHVSFGVSEDTAHIRITMESDAQLVLSGNLHKIESRMTVGLDSTESALRQAASVAPLSLIAAAVVYSVAKIVDYGKNKKIDELNDRTKSFKKELGSFENSKNIVVECVNKFKAGEISKEDLTKSLQENIHKLLEVEKHAKKLYNKADKNEDVPNSKFQFCKDTVANLLTIRETWNTLVQTAITRKESHHQFTSEVQNYTTEQLVTNLETLSKKGCITIIEEEKFKVLKDELGKRCTTEPYEKLSTLDRISDLPAPMVLPQLQRPPMPGKVFYETGLCFTIPRDKASSYRSLIRKYADVPKVIDRIESIQNQLTNAYNNQDQAAVEKAHAELQNEFGKIGPQHHFDKYEINIFWCPAQGRHLSFKKVMEHFKGFFDGTRSNADQMLKNIREAKSAKVSPQRPAILTADQVKEIKLSSGNRSLTENLNNYKTSSKDNPKRDAYYTGMAHAIEFLKAHGETFANPEQSKSYESILDIQKTYGSLSQYERITELRECLNKFSDAINKLKDNTIEVEEREANSKIANEQARRLLDFKVKDDELSYFKNPAQTRIKIEVAQTLVDVNNFHQAQLNLKNSSLEDQNHLFEVLYDLAQKVKLAKHRTLPEKDKKIIDHTTYIKVNFRDYKHFLRIKDIQSSLDTIKDCFDIMGRKGIKTETYRELYKLAHDEAESLRKLDPTLDDFVKIYGGIKAGEMLEKFHQIFVEYPAFVKVCHYTDQTLPLAATPISNYMLHFLNDFHRYEGYEEIKSAAEFASLINTADSSYFPSYINYLLALGMGENEKVTDALFERTTAIFERNIFVQSANILRHPISANSSLRKAANNAQAVSSAAQVLAKGVVLCTETFLEDNSSVAKKINTAAESTADAISAASNLLHCTNLVVKTAKYTYKGTLGSKFHKIGPSLLNAGTSCLTMYELAATDVEELKPSENFKRLIKGILPHFEGNLPENWYYYAGKDLTSTIGMTMIADRPSLWGQTLSQIATFTHNLYFDKFSDDVINAILMNCRYFLRQPPSEQRNAKLNKSFENLRHYIIDCRISSNDTLAVKNAKLFMARHTIKSYKTINSWQAVQSLTCIINSDKEVFNWNYGHLNVPVLKHIEFLFDYFRSTLVIMTYSRSEGSKLFEKSFKEICKVVESIRSQYDGTVMQKDLLESEFQDLKTDFISRFCAFYISGELSQYTPSQALEILDQVPVEDRNFNYWYCMGKIFVQLKLTANSSQRSKFNSIANMCYLESQRQLERLELAKNEKEKLFDAIRVLLKGLDNTPDYGAAGFKTKSFVNVVSRIIMNSQKS